MFRNVCDVLHVASNACQTPTGGADDRDTVLTLAAPQTATPTGAGLDVSGTPGAATVPANLTVSFDVISAALLSVATLYQLLDGRALNPNA